ncbi:MAG: tRNA guanosine(34) transglycosylase Tgt [Proteobacteria bacterium]|nr:tRNA guanosine(34) transglycosylase Tgt [Pseudomonadota bacterium]
MSGDAPRFEVGRSSGAARSGRLCTRRGTIDTPAFLPVGTHGAVRGLSVADLRAAGVQGILANTYHLHLRPGEEIVARLGGLHRFMGWSGPMLTDSGGFQVHSLSEFARHAESGVEFRSPLDGAKHFLSPESSIEIQQNLGADLIAALDVFEPITGDADEPRRALEALERTLRWAERCREAHTRRDQLLFGVLQGGGRPEQRRWSAGRSVALGFEAFAVGGLGLGESRDLRAELVEASLAELPPPAPRYLMGLGRPDDLVEAVARGIDLFDCVVPTRHGRHGQAFSDDGPFNLHNARFREDDRPLDPESGEPVSGATSRAYLHHLLRSGEVLGQRLLSQHNLAYYMRLMVRMRTAIEGDRFEDWSRGWLKRYRASD